MVVCRPSTATIENYCWWSASSYLTDAMTRGTGTLQQRCLQRGVMAVTIALYIGHVWWQVGF